MVSNNFRSPESEYSSAFPGIVGLASTTEIDQYDATNLASIAEERKNGVGAGKGKMYRPRHFSAGSREDLLRRGKSIYSSFTAEDIADVGFYLPNHVSCNMDLGLVAGLWIHTTRRPQ
jgi:hypothetical protein